MTTALQLPGCTHVSPLPRSHFFFFGQMEDVAPGLYQVDVDLSALSTNVTMSQVEDGLYDADMLRFLGSGMDDDDSCFFSSLATVPSPDPVYHLYVITPRDKAMEYVMRLPFFVSDACFLSLADYTFTSTPTWYTFSNHQSVLYLTFTTSVPPLLIVDGLREFAAWVDMCASWCMSYSHLFAPTFHPNIASILCTTQPVLLINHDHEGPVWLPCDDATRVFEHTPQVTPPPPLSAPPDCVRHMSTHLDTYAMHARLPHAQRYHVEPRIPTPLSTPAASPSPSLSPVTLQPGDWVVYLTPTADSFVCAQVVTVTPTITLDTDATPSLVAKLDAEQHSLLSDLQPLDAFVLLA